jgi:superfamily I DNA/RNA helicase
MRIIVPEINIILGPPGTGKTENLLRIMDRELKEKTADPGEIAFVTFTTRAANEASQRAQEKFNLTEDDLPYFSTLHAFGKRQLGMNNSEVMRIADYRKMADLYGIDLEYVTQDWEDTGIIHTDNKFIREINKARTKCMELDEYYHASSFNFDLYDLLKVSKSLEEFKHKNNKYDFTDMLTQWVKFGPTPKLEVVFIDEAQDLTRLQWNMCEKIWKNAKRVYISGDDDQAIYRWAGADIEYFINLEGKVKTLEHSHRCPQAVHKVAASIVSRIGNRREKIWHPRKEKGIVELHSFADSVDLSKGKWLVLATCGYMFKEIEEDLQYKGLPYKIKNKLPVEKEILSAVDAWKKLQKGENLSYKEIGYIYSYLPTKTGVAHGYKGLKSLNEDETYDLEQLTMYHGLCTSSTRWDEVFEKIGSRNINYIKSLEKINPTLSTEPNISLSTIHMAKGGECDNVMLLTDLSPANQEEMAINPDDTNRAFYVAVTRAKRQLHIVDSQSYGGFEI